MSKPYSPDISLYSNLHNFFQDFYFLNKELNPKFSYQYLAKKLNWSAPYLNDVFKGRKKLSLRRMIEFTNYLGISGPQEERFLILYLSDSDNEFAKSSLKASALSSTNSALSTSNIPLEKHQDYASVYDQYVAMYLYYKKGEWSATDFLSSLALTTKPTPEQLEDSLERLVKGKIVSFDEASQKYIINQQDHTLLHLEEKAKAKNAEDIFNEVIRMDREYAKQYLDYTLSPRKGSICAFNGLIHLNDETYKEVCKRVVALHNFLVEISEKSDGENLLNPKGPPKKVWQYQLNLFSLFE